MTTILDLEPYTKAPSGRYVENLASFGFGQAIRRELDLDRIDTQQEPCVIRIPERIDYIESGFLDGLLGPSIDVFETPEALCEHYTFESNPLVIPDINRTLSIMYRNKK